MSFADFTDDSVLEDTPIVLAAAAQGTEPMLQLPNVSSQEISAAGGDSIVPARGVEQVARVRYVGAPTHTPVRVERDSSNRNRVTSTTDVFGRVTSYGYDSLGELESVVNADGIQAGRDDRGNWCIFLPGPGGLSFPLDESLSFDQDKAALVVTYKDGKVEEWFADGAVRTQKADQGTWTRDAHGRDLASPDIHWVDSTHRYGRDGELIETITIERHEVFSTSKLSTDKLASVKLWDIALQVKAQAVKRISSVFTLLGSTACKDHQMARTADSKAIDCAPTKAKTDSRLAARAVKWNAAVSASRGLSQALSLYFQGWVQILTN